MKEDRINSIILEFFIKKYSTLINFKRITLISDLTETSIDLYQDLLDWKSVSRLAILSESFIEKYMTKINWNWVSMNKSLTLPLIDKYYSKIDWDEISLSPWITSEIMEKYNEKINWKKITLHNSNITETILEKYIPKCLWKNIPYAYSFTDKFVSSNFKYLNVQHLNLFETPKLEFLEKYHDHIDWYHFSSNFYLTPEIIEKYKDDIDFNVLCDALCQEEINQLIQKYPYKFDDCNICENIELTSEILSTFVESDGFSWSFSLENGRKIVLNWHKISSNKSLQLHTIKKYHDLMNWGLVSECSFLTSEFIIENESLLDWNAVGYNNRLTPHLIDTFKEKLIWKYIDLYFFLDGYYSIFRFVLLLKNYWKENRFSNFCEKNVFDNYE